MMTEKPCNALEKRVGPLVIIISCMIFLSAYLAVVSMSISTLSLFTSNYNKAVKPVQTVLVIPKEKTEEAGYITTVRQQFLKGSKCRSNSPI